MRWFCLAIIAIFLGGCEIDAQKGVLMHERQAPTQNQPNEEPKPKEAAALLQMQHSAALELEELRANNALALKQIEFEASQKELEVREQLAQKENEIALQTHEQNLELYKLALIIFAIVILFALLIFYLIAKKNRHTKQKMQEDKLKAEYELKQQEFYHQRVNKLLEIAASKESDEQIKKDALNMIKNDHTLRRLDFKND